MAAWLACAVAAALLAAPAALAQEPAAVPPPGGPAHAYVLEATLDPEAHVVTGSARIRWTNESALPARELWLHLYLNAFESEATVFMRESGGALRGDRFRAAGGIELEELRLADGTDLLGGA